MANIIPFRGVRYSGLNSARLSKVLAPPYDIIPTAQKKQLLAAHPLNVIRLIIGNPAHEKHTAADYQAAKKNFTAWRKKGALKREAKPSLYVYQQVFSVDGRKYRRTGFIGLSKLTPFGKTKGGILAHEHTLSGPKADRLKVMKACHANFSCIFSLYPDKGGVERLLRKITKKKADINARFPQDVENRVWVVSDSVWIKELQRKIKSATLFIADGHHRYETALAYQAFRSGGKKSGSEKPHDYVQMMFVAMEDPGLVILPTHRMLPKRHVPSPPLLLSRLSSLGEVVEYAGPLTGLKPWEWMAGLGKQEPTIGISFDGRKLYALRFSKETSRSLLLKDVSDAQKKLDVTLLHRLVLEPFFGITREKVEHEISFTSRAMEAVDRLRRGEFGVVFFLNPTRIGQLRQVAMLRERMPQKSTYFYPKLVTGLVFNDLDSF
jgi:uncharacterized protein (DUF1015 family)